MIVKVIAAAFRPFLREIPFQLQKILPQFRMKAEFHISLEMLGGTEPVCFEKGVGFFYAEPSAQQSVGQASL